MVRNSVIAATVVILLAWVLVVVILPIFARFKHGSGREHFTNKGEFTHVPQMKNVKTHDTLAYSLGF